LIKSMTGYGRGDATSERERITVETKSVNNRFLEIVVRMPKQFLPLEERVKKIVQEKLNRGRVDVFISLEETGENKRMVKVDKELGLAYYNSLKELAATCKIPENIDLIRMYLLPGLLTLEEEEKDLESVWLVIKEALVKSVDALVGMRAIEGAKLAQDLLHRKRLVSDCVRQIGERSPVIVTEYQEKMHQRVQELLGQIEIDESKLANEIAFFADKASITEELVRLESHFNQMENILSCDDTVGRKLDFLVQEMNREINTIGSKANDLTVSHLVVAVKSELEKVREQVQNIE
jgi:uncharacterized protein (TIGR00255 family)